MPLPLACLTGLDHLAICDVKRCKQSHLSVSDYHQGAHHDAVSKIDLGVRMENLGVEGMEKVG